MIARASKTLFLASASLLIAGMAHAEAPDNRDVVHDARGNVVKNTFGNCVRTKWEGSADECGAAPPPPAPVAAPVRRPLSQEERTVYFDFNKSTLRGDQRQKLNTLAGALKSDTQVKQANIVGYADRIGNTSYNERLSKKRAETVRNYLQSQGFINARVANTRWLGESAPVTNCPDSLSRPELIQCLQKDRRVEVEIEYQPVSGQ